MSKLKVLLAFSGLELIPEELWELESVRRKVKRLKKKRWQLLLDNFRFREEIKRLEHSEMRGRPDIAHFCLLLALESLLNKKGYLKIWIHTFNGEIIEIKPEVRLPRHYERFQGLMAQVLRKGRAPSKGEWLIRKMELSLDEFLSKFPEKVLLHEKGRKIRPGELVKRDCLFVIGAFQRGDFPRWFLELFPERYSIFEAPLTAWTVLSELIIAKERALGII